MTEKGRKKGEKRTIIKLVYRLSPPSLKVMSETSFSFPHATEKAAPIKVP